MKKILLATTVLAMTATVAAAEVAVSGNGRMGVTYNKEAENTLAFTSRVRVAFAMSGETDGGLAFGGSIRADNSAAGAAGTAGSVFISGAFGKLSMGDVAGAAEFVVGDLAGVGMTGLGDWNENVYISNSRRPTARYEYSAGSLTVAVSADNPGTDGALVDYAVAGGFVEDTFNTEKTYSVGVKYAVDGYAVALGYESSNIDGRSIDQLIVGAEANLSGVALKATYGTAGLVPGVDFTQYGVSATYAMDAVSVSAFYRQEEITTFPKFTAVGVGATYDLGGGASVAGGISRAKVDGEGSNTRADLGVSFSF